MLNIEEFLNTLPIMLYGMGGIFIVTIIIFFCIKAMCKIFK